MRVFVLFFVGMFAYFFLPNYMFYALSAFNWLSWIAPTNPGFNTVVGFNNGLGLNPWPTFDWNIGAWRVFRRKGARSWSLNSDFFLKK